MITQYMQSLNSMLNSNWYKPVDSKCIQYLFVEIQTMFAMYVLVLIWHDITWTFYER